MNWRFLFKEAATWTVVATALIAVMWSALLSWEYYRSLPQ